MAIGANQRQVRIAAASLRSVVYPNKDEVIVGAHFQVGPPGVPEADVVVFLLEKVDDPAKD